MHRPHSCLHDDDICNNVFNDPCIYIMQLNVSVRYITYRLLEISSIVVIFVRKSLVTVFLQIQNTRRKKEKELRINIFSFRQQSSFILSENIVHILYVHTYVHIS